MGAYIQRICSAFYDNAINKNAAPRIDHGSWSFETRKWCGTPLSDYEEPEEPCEDLLNWVILEALCPEFGLDEYGSLHIVSLSAYVSRKIFLENLIISKFHMEDGSWQLVDISDRRLGHPLKILRALCEASPKTVYPWPAATEPLGCERAAICLLLGMVPYPNQPPFYTLIVEKLKMVLLIEKQLLI